MNKQNKGPAPGYANVSCALLWAKTKAGIAEVDETVQVSSHKGSRLLPVDLYRLPKSCSYLYLL